MALQRMNLVPPELWENSYQESLTPVKEVPEGMDHCYNKWIHVRLQQDCYFKTKKQKREPIHIPITATGITKPSFKTKHKRKLFQCLCLNQNLNQTRKHHLRIQSKVITY
jgi:hypothetical protein